MDPLLIPFGLAIGMLVGMTGMGGGSLMTPLLILVFGTAPVTAVGSDIAYSAVTKTVGAWRHFRLKTVNLWLALWLAAGSVQTEAPSGAMARHSPRSPLSPPSTNWAASWGLTHSRSGGGT